MADIDAGEERRAQRFVFSTDELPAGVDERTRVRLWRDLEAELFGSLDVSYAEDRPFQARAEAIPFGAIALVRLVGAFTKAERTPRGTAADGQDGFVLGINRSRSPLRYEQRGRETLLAHGAACLISQAEAGRAQLEPGTEMLMVTLPRGPLVERVGCADDLAARPIDRRQPILRHLQRYVDILLEPDGTNDDPALAAHVETTLLDLIALTLGAGSEATELAAMRGLRAARLQAVLALIKSRFADATFSVHDVAGQLGLSPRYIQELLHQTGSGLSERVLELRLQKARRMLERADHSRAYVSQIAYACGFNGVSYFNRCFRRRFGTSPTAARGDSGRP